MKKIFFIGFLLISGGFLVKCSQKNLLEPTTAQSYDQRGRTESSHGVKIPNRMSAFDSINFGFKRWYNFTSPEPSYYPEGSQFDIKNPNPTKPLRKVYLLLHSPEDVAYGRCDNDWRIPHRIIQANHARITDTVWIPIEEQREAYMMLDKYLFLQKNTQEVQAAIAIYAEWLLKNDARETEITRQALVRLKGYWTEKQIREAEKRLARTHQWQVVDLQQHKEANARLGAKESMMKLQESARKHREAKLKVEKKQE